MVTVWVPDEEVMMQVESPCPLDELLAIIGGKWKVIILWHLQEGMMRFSELRKKMPGITQKMLTQQLRDLEHQQMVIRKVYAEVPPRVEYQLTEKGKQIKPLLHQMQLWSTQNLAAESVLDQAPFH
jgi:DNA-binding HxlR family transcriptional regulator